MASQNMDSVAVYRWQTPLVVKTSEEMSKGSIRDPAIHGYSFRAPMAPLHPWTAESTTRIQHIGIT